MRKLRLMLIGPGWRYYGHSSCPALLILLAESYDDRNVSVQVLNQNNELQVECLLWDHSGPMVCFTHNLSVYCINYDWTCFTLEFQSGVWDQNLALSVLVVYVLTYYESLGSLREQCPDALTCSIKYRIPLTRHFIFFFSICEREKCSICIECRCEWTQTLACYILHIQKRNKKPNHFLEEPLLYFYLYTKHIKCNFWK